MMKLLVMQFVMYRNNSLNLLLNTSRPSLQERPHTPLLHCHSLHAQFHCPAEISIPTRRWTRTVDIPVLWLGHINGTCRIIHMQFHWWRMAYSGMLRRVALIWADVSEELSPSFICMTGIDEIGTTPAVSGNWRTRASVASYSWRCSLFTDSCHTDEGVAKFLRNVGSYKNHTA
jgi:hypothetical protein